MMGMNFHYYTQIVNIYAISSYLSYQSYLYKIGLTQMLLVHKMRFGEVQKLVQLVKN